MKKITILIAEDYKLVRETWGIILNSDPRFTVVGEAATGEEAVEKAKALRPDIVIMDINLPGMNGFEATEQVKKYSPGSKILGVSLHTQPAYVKKMMKKGANGYVTKNSSREEMLHAIIEVHQGNKYLCNEIKEIISQIELLDQEESGGINVLSERELKVVKLIKEGLSSKEISAELNIAVKTVEVHRYNILKKLNLKNTAALVNYINNCPLED